MKHLGNPLDPRHLARQVLTSKEYEAWEAVEIRGWSIRQVAREVSISPAAVRTRLTGAKKKLIVETFVAAPPKVRGQVEKMALSLLIQRDGPICYLCRSTVDPAALTIEHVIPSSRGGTDEAENLAVACSSCNSRKRDSFVSLRVPSGAPMYHPR